MIGTLAAAVTLAVLLHAAALVRLRAILDGRPIAAFATGIGALALAAAAGIAGARQGALPLVAGAVLVSVLRLAAAFARSGDAGRHA